MEATGERPPAYTASKKRDVLIGALVWNAVGTIATWIATGAGPVYEGVAIVQAVGNAVATLLWCHIDAAEHDIKLGPGFRLLVIFLSPLALIYYLFRSRGFRQGLVAIARAIAFVFALAAMMVVIEIALAPVSDRMGVFVQP